MATPRKTASSEGGSDETPTKKAPAKKSAAKKAPAKKTTAKKAPARKSATKKAPAGKSSDESSGEASSSSPRSSGSGARSEEKPAKKVPAMKVARAAAQQLAELTGRVPECVVGVQRAEDGWEVDLEVVESRRIPDSTDILAIYRVETDDDGDLIGYQRLRRYVRGKGGDGGDR